MPKVLIGCKLPNGIVLDGMSGPVALNGANTSLVIGGGFGLTYVDEGEAAYLMAAYAEHSAFKSKSIFTQNSASVDDIADLADDLKENTTGLEGVNPDTPAPGLAPADTTQKAMAEAKATPRPATPVATKADRAAAVELATKQ